MANARDAFSTIRAVRCPINLCLQRRRLPGHKTGRTEESARPVDDNTSMNGIVYGTGNKVNVVPYFVLITPIRSLVSRMWAEADGCTPSNEMYCPNV